MAQIFGLRDLQERKRALVAESEIYRQTLKLEIQNIRLYRVRVQRKLDLLRFANPFLLLAGSYVGTRLFGRKSRWKRRRGLSLFGTGLMAWRLLRTYGPFLQKMILQSVLGRSSAGAAPPEEQTPAARI